ncbi:MAG: hypothetical protein ACRDO0_18335 [Nocardioidaceae bacterium]
MASGDPWPHRVVLWTRTAPDPDAVLHVGDYVYEHAPVSTGYSYDGQALL